MTAIRSNAALFHLTAGVVAGGTTDAMAPTGPGTLTASYGWTARSALTGYLTC
jgi:hypothetical protein